MNPDPNRQWYVYFKDTELGPFSEADLLSKLGSKEFDESAFVYTDGMSNWEAVTGVDVLMKPKAPQAAFAERDPSAKGRTSTSLKINTVTQATVNPELDSDMSFAPESSPSSGEVSKMVDAEYDPLAGTPPAGEELQSVVNDPGFDAPQFLERDPTQHEPEPSIALDSGEWGASPDAGAQSPEPLRVESLGMSSAAAPQSDDLPPLPPQVDDFASTGEDAPQIASELSESSPDKGEFGEEVLSGSRAGAFPEDENRLSNAGSPVASSKTGIKLRRGLPLVLRLILVLVFILVAAVAAVKFTPLGKEALPAVQLLSEVVGYDFVKALDLKPGAPDGQTAAGSAANPQTAASATPVVEPSTEEKIAIELENYKKNSNGDSVAVKVASNWLMGDRPLLIGMVSPQVMADRKLKRLTIAVFPQADRNFMVTPRVWRKDIALYDDVFSIGPLTDKGEALPVGAYQVLFMSDATELGGHVFQIGRWPEEPELSAKLKELESKRIVAATEERKFLDEKFNILVGLATELEKAGREKAIQPGNMNRKAWLSFSQSWLNSYDALGRDLRGYADYLFYNDAHTDLLEYYKSLRRILTLTEAYSQGGAKAFIKASKLTRFTDLAVADAKARDAVKAKLLALEGMQIAPPRINPDEVKNSLRNR